MSFFQKLLAAFNSSVKEGPWLQFVGMFVCLGGLIGVCIHAKLGFWAVISVGFSYIGLGVAFAGYYFNNIYK